MQVIVQNCLGLRLRYEEDERETGVWRTDVSKRDCRNRSAFEVQLEARARIASGDEPFPEAKRLEQLERSRLNGEGPRFACAIQQPVDDSEAGAKHLKLSRQCQPSWTSAYDQRLKPRFVRRHFSVTGSDTSGVYGRSSRPNAAVALPLSARSGAVWMLQTDEFRFHGATGRLTFRCVQVRKRICATAGQRGPRHSRGLGYHPQTAFPNFLVSRRPRTVT